jgi:hypothetical protein
MAVLAAWMAGAVVLGLGLGAALGVARASLLGGLLLAVAIVPPGVVGLGIRFGWFGASLAAPAAAGVALLAVSGLAHRAVAPAWAGYGPGLLMAGVSRWRALPHIVRLADAPLALAVLAGVARMAAEIGGVMLATGGDPLVALALLGLGVAETAVALALAP